MKDYTSELWFVSPIQPAGSIEIEGTIRLNDTLSYQIFGAVQIRDENLSAMPKPQHHRFAVIYEGSYEDNLINTLERALDLGGLAPVKLIGVSENSLYIILDDCVGGSTLASIDAVWSAITNSDQEMRWGVSFASESEIWSGRSDFSHPQEAMVVLSTNRLGIQPMAEHVAENSENEFVLGQEEEVLSRKGEGTLQASATLKCIDHKLVNYFNHISQQMTRHYIKGAEKNEHQARLECVAWLALHTGLRASHCVTLMGVCPYDMDAPK
jgi:hypothetical protein